jgi:hypothetical protein
MSNTSMGTNLLQSFQIFSKLIIEGVCEELRVLSVDNIFLSIEEPLWNLVLGRILEDGDNTFELFSGKFSGTRVRIELLREQTVC